MKKAILTLKIISTMMLISWKLYSQNETVTIGNKVWMTKNLDVDKFRNGDPIPQVRSSSEWEKAKANKQPAWCYYEYDSDNGTEYGKLYNWYAVKDARGLAPEGYHIPSKDEWYALKTYLGEDVADKLKSNRNYDWINIYGRSCNGTNESGFSGLSGGYLGEFGFGFASIEGRWWSSTAAIGGLAEAFSLTCSSFGWETFSKQFYMYSVRCLKDY
jgi:uncharacterized protein (TIGR02145 family)